LVSLVTVVLPPVSSRDISFCFSPRSAEVVIPIRYCTCGSSGGGGKKTGPTVAVLPAQPEKTHASNSASASCLTFCTKKPYTPINLPAFILPLLFLLLRCAGLPPDRGRAARQPRLLVDFRLAPIVFQLPVTAGSAAPAGLGGGEVDWNLPVAEL